MYEFSPTDEQELLMEAADQFMDSCGFDEEYFKRCYDEHRVPEEYYAALKESPFGTLGLPEQFGGVPVDQVTMMLVQERFFRRNFPFNTPVLQIKDAQGDRGIEDESHGILPRHIGAWRWLRQHVHRLDRNAARRQGVPERHQDVHH